MLVPTNCPPVAPLAIWAVAPPMPPLLAVRTLAIGQRAIGGLLGGSQLVTLGPRPHTIGACWGLVGRWGRLVLVRPLALALALALATLGAFASRRGRVALGRPRYNSCRLVCLAPPTTKGSKAGGLRLAPPTGAGLGLAPTALPPLPPPWAAMAAWAWACTPPWAGRGAQGPPWRRPKGATPTWQPACAGGAPGCHGRPQARGGPGPPHRARAKPQHLQVAGQAAGPRAGPGHLPNAWVAPQARDPHGAY